MIKLDKSKLVYNLGKKNKLVPYLEKAIAESNDDWEYKFKDKQHDHHWHPSSHPTLPPSELFAIATATEVEQEKISPGLRKAFQVGHFWHQWLQYIVVEKLKFAKWDDIERPFLKSWGDKEVAKVGINEHGLTAKDWKPAPYHSVAGSLDVAPCVAPNWTGVVDFKTMNERDFKHAGVPDWLATKYECQMNLYMDGVGQDECLLLCIEKDSPHEFREFLYKRNQPLIDHIYEKFKFVSSAVDEGLEIPNSEDENWDLSPLLTGPIAS